MIQRVIHMRRSARPDGFTLPVVLLVSIGLMIIALSLTQSTASISDSISDQYLNRLAGEAAESGIAYANICLNDNSFNQTWDTNADKPLTQATDCSGTTLAGAPPYLMTNLTYRTSFTVANLEARSDGALIVSVTGKFEQTQGSSSTVVRTYTTVKKEVVKWKTYQASISASGTNKTCGIVTGELYCWGRNTNNIESFAGQLGDGTTTDSLVPVKVRQDPGVLKAKTVDDIFSAQYHNCALATGKVYCWGNNDQGQLGQGTNAGYSTVPVEVGGVLSGKTVTDIGGSGDTSCAIADGKVYCWGRNSKGQVGVNSTTDMYTVPTPVVATGDATGLAINYTATRLASSGSRSYDMCVVADGGAYCWGNNDAGQIGNGTSGTTNVLVPTKVTDSGVLAGKTVTAISQDGYAGGPYSHVCAVASGGVYCWGENNSGQLGRDSGSNKTVDSSVPVAVFTGGVLAGKTVQDVVVGLQHSCALADGKVYCWGNRSAGQVGDGVTSGTPAYVPVAVKATASSDALYSRTVTAIGGGANRGCAVADLKSYCWGLNADGQLGDNTLVTKNFPVRSYFLDPKAPTYVF